MVLIINGVDRGIAWNDLVVFVHDYESAFDVVTNYVGQGLQLESAVVMDGSRKTDLPVEAFDGRILDSHTQLLERQWTTILGQWPGRQTVLSKQRSNEWDFRLVQYYETQIRHLEEMTERLKQALHQSTIGKQTPHRVHQATQYKALLLSQYKQLASIRFAHQRAIDRLNEKAHS